MASGKQRLRFAAPGALCDLVTEFSGGGKNRSVCKSAGEPLRHISAF
jgi:hypothetical protein